MIPDGDWIEISPPVNDSERRALETLKEILSPPKERYAVVSNVRLPNGRADFYEYDAIVVTPNMLFALEFKGWSGRIVCQRDSWFLEDGTYYENPSNLIARKAKNLGGLLVGRVRSLRERLWVQDLVYVNGAGAKLTDIDYERRASFDVTPTSFDSPVALKSALLKPERWCRPQTLEEAERRSILAYLRGGERRVVDERIGKYLIDERFSATSDRFERLLAHERFEPGDPSKRVELHVYPLDGRRMDADRTSKAFRRQIATVKALGKAGVAPDYLGDAEALWNGRNVRYIAYEWLGRYETVGDRIGRTGTIGLCDTLRLALTIAEAIAVMHGQAIVHGALEPAALHVKDEIDLPQVLIGRIELARPRDASTSIDTISTVGSNASCYASPSVLAGRYPDEADDIFSFGAILAHMLRGRPLFASPSEILQQLRLPRLLDDRSADPPELRRLVAALLARDAKDRPPSMRDVVGELRSILSALEGPGQAEQRIGRYTICRELRAGATGRTVVARRDDLAGEVVLKIAPLGRDETLRREIEQLRQLRHPNIVAAYNGEALDKEGVYVGEFALAPGDDCERLRGNVFGERMHGLARGLLSALAYVHEHGLVHRDVKPANVMLGPDGAVTLLDFGLACAPGDADLVIGTAPYKPEQLFVRGRWQPSDDVFAAVVTLWETMIGKHPWKGMPPQGPPTVEASELGNLIAPATAEELAAVVRDLLSDPPDGENAANVAGSRLVPLLEPPRGAMLLPFAPPEIALPAGAQLETSVRELPMNVRARQALDDLGVRTLDDVRRLRVADLSRAKGFGRGTADEVAAVARAVIARFGEAEPAATTVLRQVETALAPLLVGDDVAVAANLEVLQQLSVELRAALAALGIATVAQLAASDARALEGDVRIGMAGAVAIRTALQAFVEDSKGLLVSAALPAWRMAERGAFEENLARLGVDASRALDILETAGGFELTPQQVPALHQPVVAAPPWTEAAARAALQALAAEVEWPPRELSELAVAVAARLEEDGLETSAIANADSGRLFVERIVPSVADLARTADGRWYRKSALDVRRAIEYGSDGLALPARLAPFLQAVERRLPAFRLPSPGAPEFASALDAAGFVWPADGLIYRKGAVPTPKAKGESDLVGADVVALPTAAAALERAARSGGYRLVVAEPGVYSVRVRALLDELRTVFADRLRAIDFDAELCRALREAGTLETALRVQAKKGPVPGAIGPLADEAATRILDGALAVNDDACTVVFNTGSLALTNVAQHLGKIYDRARGGRHGLVVVCVPGDHPREHARLNRIVPLPQQPTERPIALEESA